MICAELLTATAIILALQTELKQVILVASPNLVSMSIDNFNLPWEVVREESAFTIVRRKQ